jgi:ABC-type nickel/cobalt efflux system permease component RcnA
MVRHFPALAALLILALVPPGARAHPVPSTNHDRTIVVRLGWDAPSKQYVVLVDYRLELGQLLLAQDMADHLGRIDLERAARGDGGYAEFTRLFAPVLAQHLDATAGGKPVRFRCVHRQFTLTDEKGESLGHVRCDFRFRAAFPPPAPGKPQQFELTEHNYIRDETYLPGKVDLSLVGDASVHILRKEEPGAALKKRPETQLGPDDEERLRTVAATFEPTSAPRAEPPLPAAGGGEPEGLLGLLFNADRDVLWVLLLVAVGLGAVHALTPGHGKTLVAAYLVGQHGTTLHAVVLGVVTTLTHTGGVLLLAVGLQFLGERERLQVAGGLGLVMGLLVAGLGAWLLLRRLAGGADHVHIGGGHHYHHHGHTHADHDHDVYGNLVPRKRPVGWRGLVVLGMSGGIVPCWDAVAMLVLAVGMGRLALALPLLLAFSAGLAGVLVLVGVLVVHARGFAQSRWGEGRLVRALPVLSALVVTALGVWLCHESLHATLPPP